MDKFKGKYVYNVMIVGMRDKLKNITFKMLTEYFIIKSFLNKIQPYCGWVGRNI